MKGHHKYLLLTEVLFAFIIFFIVSAACVPVFSKAVQYKKQSVELDNAVRLCSSIMEICLSENEYIIAEIYHGEKEDSGWIVFLDKNFEPSPDAEYIVKTKAGRERINITMYKNGTEELYSVSSIIN